MPRIAFFEKQEPVEVEGKLICQCGLSEKFPFCDNSHLKTKDEEKMKVYQYIDGERMVVGEMHQHGDGCGCGDDCDCDDKEDKCGCGHDH